MEKEKINKKKKKKKKFDIKLDENEFDYIIFGTGLTESLLSSALAIQKNKILNIDLNPYYSTNMRSVNLKSFLKFVNRTQEKNEMLRDTITQMKFYNNLPENEVKEKSKSYNIDLQPKLIFSESLPTDKMIDAQIDKYMDFSLIYGLSLFDPETKKFI